MSSEVMTSHHNHHHHHHTLSRSQTLDRNQTEKSTKQSSEPRRCAKHATPAPKSPAPARPKEPPKVTAKEQTKVMSKDQTKTTATTPVSRRSQMSHSAGCRKLNRSQSTSSSSSRPSSSPNQHCHGPVRPVIITQYKERGDQLVTEAESKLSRSLFRAGDVQGGLECYQRAVAQYKLAGDWDTAADTLMKMGDILRKQGDHVGAGRLYGDAGTCYRKYSITAAVNAFLKSAEMYIELGKFGMPAKHHETIALIYSKDLQSCDQSAVLHHLSIAADYYYNDNRNAARNKCRLEMARIYCSMNQYSEALQIYEELGYSSLESRLIKYSADEYFFRAGLCHLAIDCLNCQIAIQKYIDYYPAFEVSGECKLLKLLCSEVEQENEENFDIAVKKNNSIVKLDPWYGAVISKIRKEIPGELNSLR